MACPKCQKVLRVRAEYLGHRVVCRHCQDGFRVTTDGVASRIDVLKAELEKAQKDQTQYQTRLQTVEADLRQAGDRRQQFEAAQVGTTREMSSLREERDRLLAEGKQLRGQVEPAKAGGTGELTSLREERDRLADDVKALREQVEAARDGAPGELTSLREERDRLLEDVKQHRAQAETA